MSEGFVAMSSTSTAAAALPSDKKPYKDLCSNIQSIREEMFNELASQEFVIALAASVGS